MQGTGKTRKPGDRDRRWLSAQLRNNKFNYKYFLQTTPWAGFNIPPAYYLSTIFRFPLKAPKAAKKNLPRREEKAKHEGP
jgi:hypothetical protein